MTLESVLKFYFTHFPTIKLQIEKTGGVPGRYRIASFKDILWILSYYGDMEVVNTCLSTYYTTLNQLESKCDYPLLYILIK